MPVMTTIKQQLNLQNIAMGAVALAHGAPAIAQEAPAEPKEDEGLIIVTGERDPANVQVSATKSPLTIKETPQAISVVTAESLEQRQVREINAALEAAAGVAGVGNSIFSGASNEFGDVIVLRGQLLDGARDNRIDGAAVNLNEAKLDTAYFDRIEVIKGPSSLLYGPSSLSGFVNRVSKKPTSEAELTLAVSGGSYNSYRFEADFSGPLGGEALAGRLVAVADRTGSFVDDVFVSTIGIAPSARVILGEDTRLLVQAIYQEADGVPGFGIPLIRADDGTLSIPDLPRSTFLGVVGDSDLDQSVRQARATLEQQIGDRWLATLQLNYSSTDFRFTADNYAYGLYPGDISYFYSRISNQQADTWGGELRLNGEFELFGSNHKLVAGADVSDISNNRNLRFVIIGAANIFGDDYLDFEPQTPPLRPDRLGDRRTYGGYVQGIFNLTDRTRFITGLRYDRATATIRNQGPGGPSFGGTRSKATYRVALSHDFSDAVTVFGAYATSFVPNLANDREGRPLEPETGEGIEGGIKLNAFDGRLAGTITAYRQRRDNVPIGLQRNIECPDLPGCSRAGNPQVTKGIEVELTARPWTGAEIGVAASWIDSEYVDPDEPDFGQPTFGSIERQTNFFFNQRLLDKFDIGATLVSVGDRTALFRSPDQLGGYERLDLTAGFEPRDDLKLSLLVRNVTDNRYIENLYYTPGLNFFGSPRAFLLRLSYKPSID